MNTEQIFEELGLSPLMAVDLMSNLDISTEHLNDPHIFGRLQTVIEFLKSYPDDTQRFLIRKATIGKQNKLQVMHEYIHLLKDKKFYEDSLEKVKSERSAVEVIGDLAKLQELDIREIQNNTKINQIKEEIELYHK